jgi:tRNA A-37 threonylcarbamoyl transferase component Bud32
MNPLFDIIGGSTQFWIDSNLFEKEYIDITDEHWERIKNIYILASEYNISPKLVSINEDERILSWELITPFETGESDVPEVLTNFGLTVNDIREKILEKVSILHSLGYGHGDLHIGNIGLTFDGRPTIFDFDTAYNILDDKNSEWLQQYIIEGFGKYITYEEFVQHDFTNWQTDWIDC